MSEEVATPVDTPMDAAIAEQKQQETNKSQTVTVQGKDFRLHDKLTVAATYGIAKAQKDEDLAGLIDASTKMIHEDDREAFLEAVLADEKLDMEEFSNIFADALEKVTGRPLEQ